jgi:hypothetical protein
MTTLLQTIRHAIAAHNGSPPVIGGVAFAVGLVFGICVFVIPFAMSKSGKSAEVKQVATASTSGATAPASPAPVAQGKPESVANTVTAANEPAAAQDTATACDRQAWPYVTRECRRKNGARDRNVRVVTTEANTPSVIVSPAPTVTPRAPVKQPTQQATQPPPAESSAAAVAARPPWAQTLHAQITPVATQAQASSTQTPTIGAAQNAMEAQPKPTEVQPMTASEHRARATEDTQSGKKMVRTIEFADGRKVTITRPIGKGGAAAATAELDRASQRELARQQPEEYEPNRQPAMAQADDDDLDTAPRTSRRRLR